jgi:hypothetical protein
VLLCKMSDYPHQTHQKNLSKKTKNRQQKNGGG